MKTRVLSVFTQLLCWLFSSRECQTAVFTASVALSKPACAVWLQAHPDSRAGGKALREQMGSLQAAPREMLPGCQLPPRSREPGPLGMRAERDKLTLPAAFLLSDLKKKKKAPRDNLPSVTTAQNTKLEVRWHTRGPQLYRFWALCPRANCFTSESLFLLYKIGGAAGGGGRSSQRSRKN